MKTRIMLVSWLPFAFFIMATFWLPRVAFSQEQNATAQVELIQKDDGSSAMRSIEAEQAPIAEDAKTTSPRDQPHCLECSSVTTAQLAGRVELLRIAVESAKNQPTFDAHQDSKAIILNIISTRIDSWIFGNSSKGIGVAALSVAALALFFSIFRMVWSGMLLKRDTPSTKWGRFRARLRTNKAVLFFNFVTAVFSVVFAASALYVIHVARTSSPVNETAMSELKTDLMACQTDLAEMSAASARTLPPAQFANSSPDIKIAIEDLRKSCETNSQATQTQLSEIKDSVDSVKSKQPWVLTKMFVFLALILAVLGVGYLVFRE